MYLQASSVRTTLSTKQMEQLLEAGYFLWCEPPASMIIMYATHGGIDQKLEAERITKKHLRWDIIGTREYYYDRELGRHTSREVNR